MRIIPQNKRQPSIFQTIMASYLIWNKSLVMTIPFGLVNLISSYILIPNFLYNKTSNQEFLDDFSLSLVIRIGLLFIITLATHISTIYIVNQNTQNQSIHFIQAIKLGFIKCLGILITLALSIVVLTVTFCPILFFILQVFPNVFNSKLSIYIFFFLALTPGIIIHVYFILAIYLLVIDENSIITSIKNSFYLVSGSWKYVAAIFLMIIGIHQGYTFVVGNPNSSVHCLLTSCPFTLLIMPFIHAFIVTLLYNLKAKHSL